MLTLATLLMMTNWKIKLNSNFDSYNERHSLHFSKDAFLNFWYFWTKLQQKCIRFFDFLQIWALKDFYHERNFIDVIMLTVYNQFWYHKFIPKLFEVRIWKRNISQKKEIFSPFSCILNHNIQYWTFFLSHHKTDSICFSQTFTLKLFKAITKKSKFYALEIICAMIKINILFLLLKYSSWTRNHDGNSS